MMMHRRKQKVLQRKLDELDKLLLGQPSKCPDCLYFINDGGVNCNVDGTCTFTKK